jgi:hypothetical protein
MIQHADDEFLTGLQQTFLATFVKCCRQYTLARTMAMLDDM